MEEAVRTQKCGGGTNRTQHRGVRAEGRAWWVAGVFSSGDGEKEGFPLKRWGTERVEQRSRIVKVPVI